MRWVLIVVAVGVIGCVKSSSEKCGERVCPRDSVCTEAGDRCASADEIRVCLGVADGMACNAGTIVGGICNGGGCIASGCGNGVKEPGEMCDDGNRVSLDGCRADCMSTESCGDGIIDRAFGEECDCDPSIDPNCTCRPNCLLPRCGDTITDPGELCDDGNHLNFDGCRADCQGRFTKIPLPVTGAVFQAWTGGPNAILIYVSVTGVFQYDGTAWTNIRPYASGNTPAAIAASSLTDIYYLASNYKFVTHFDGVSETQIPLSMDQVNFIHVRAANDVYIGGDRGSDGSGDLEHFDGTSWTRVTGCMPIDSELVSMAFVGDKIFVFGRSELTMNHSCRFDGTTWTETADDGYSAAVIGDTVYTVVGGGADVLRAYSPTGTSTITVPGFAGVMVSTGESLLMPGNGVLLEYKNATWSSAPIPTEQYLTTIAASSPMNVVIGLQTGGAILR